MPITIQKHHATQQDAYLRVLDARTGSLPPTATPVYLHKLRSELYRWLEQIELEIADTELYARMCHVCNREMDKLTLDRDPYARVCGDCWQELEDARLAEGKESCIDCGDPRGDYHEGCPAWECDDSDCEWWGKGRRWEASAQ